jgi:hypothetical protein
MAYLVDQVRQPTSFVNEPIPETFKASFDLHKLYTPLGSNPWPTRWTHDPQRQVALVAGGTDGRAAAEADVPTTFWKTLIVEGLPVGMVYKDGASILEEKDPTSGRSHVIDKLVDAHIYLPAQLYGRKEEIIALAEEAYYAYSDGPALPWIRGVVIEVAQYHLDTEYRSARHGV